MKNIISLFFSLTCLLYLECLSFSGNTSIQIVQFEVGEINEISVSSNPETLYILPAQPGNLPPEVSENSTTYNITTTGSNKKITVHLDGSSYDPEKCYLKVSLQPPPGAISLGDVQIPWNNSIADLVRNINKLKASNLGITYRFKILSEEGLRDGYYDFYLVFTLTNS